MITYPFSMDICASQFYSALIILIKRCSFQLEIRLTLQLNIETQKNQMKTLFTLLILFIYCGASAQQVTLVKDIWPESGHAIGMFHKPYVYNDRLYFTANDGQNGEEYWVSDGTEAGTILLKDIHEGAAHAVPDYTQYSRYPGLMEFDGYLYFTANSDGYGEELWRTDGTTAGTTQCFDIYPDHIGSSPTYFHVYKDMMFFTAYHPEYQREPYILRHEGGEPTINNLGDLYTTNNNLTTMWNTYNYEHGNKVVTFLDTLIFSWYDSNHGLETWITNGNPQETHELFDHYPSFLASGAPSNYTVLQDSILCFTVFDGTGYGLWKMERNNSLSNGFEISLLQYVNSIMNADFSNFLVHNDKLYFSAEDETHGQELWISDGTSEGTYMLKDIMPGSNHSDPRNLVSFNGHVYFTVYNSSLDQYGQIWRTDGTEAGTVSCASLWSSNINRSMSSTKWKEFNGKLYFSGYEPALGEHYLSYYDGGASGPQWVLDEDGGIAAKMPTGMNSFTQMGDALYFAASSNGNNIGFELYKLTDSTPSNIHTINIAEEIVAYPNPTKEVITIKSNLQGKKGTLSIFNTSGQLIHSTTISQNSTRLNTTEWSEGIYTIRLTTDNAIRYLKVVKQ